MHKKIHTQQSRSVTNAIKNKKDPIYSSTRSAYSDHARQQGIKEHAHFEKVVAHFYSCDAQPLPFFIRIFPLLVFILILGVVASLFLAFL